MGIVLQAAVVYPRHLLVVVQELCHLLCVLAVLCHTQMECLQAEVQQECVLRSGNRSEVAHQLCHELRRKAHLSECLHIRQSVIRLIGRTQSGELLCIREPVKVAAIHHDTAYLCSQSVHILRGGVGDDVCAPLEGTAVHGCGKRIIDDQGHPVLMGDLGEALYVEHGAARIRDRLAEHSLRIRAEGSLYLLVAGLLRDECALDAELLQRHAEEVIGAAVDFVRGDEMVASLTDVEDGVEVCGLS